MQCNKNIPELRFPEFEEEWEEKKLSQINKITMGQSPSSKYYTKNQNDTILVQGNQDIANNYVIPRIYTSKITKIAKKGEILLTVRAPVGDIVITQYDVCIGRGVCSIKPSISTGFMFFYLAKLNSKNQWNKYIQGSTFESINSKDITSMKIKIPKSSKEQEKIANFLTCIDQKISFMEKKHTLYQNIKKYLLKNLFAHKSEYPILRFNFNDKLKKITLKDILKESKIKTNDDINKRLTVKLNLNGITKRIPNTSEVEGATTQYLRKSGQFIYGKQNLHNGAFGIIPSYLDGYLSSSDIPSFDFIKSIDKFWLYYYFSDKDYYHRLERLSTGTGSKRISPTDFLKIKINMPSFNEQEKIVDLISSLDIKINEIQKQIKNTKKFKKGLLQKMFC